MKNKIIIPISVLALVTGIICSRATVPQTQTILKSYFVSNAIPTQAQYAEFIDTMFWYANQTYSNTLVAQEQAAIVNQNWSNIPPVVVTGKLDGKTTLTLATNCSYTSNSGSNTVITFSSPMPNTNYTTIAAIKKLGFPPSTNIYFNPYAPNSLTAQIGIRTTTNMTIFCTDNTLMWFGIYTNLSTAVQVFYNTGASMFPYVSNFPIVNTTGLPISPLNP